MKLSACKGTCIMDRRREARLCNYPARRIALIKPSALGDIVHSLPVLTALRQRYPHAFIAWVVNRGYAELLHGHPDLDAVLPFERGASQFGLVTALRHYGRFFHSFRQQRFDLAIDLQGLFRSGLMAAFSGAARRVGLSTAREGARVFYTDVIEVPNFHSVHAVDRYWLVADAFGVGHLGKSFHVPLGETQRNWATMLLRDCPRPWMAFGVGARWQTKRWPPKHFAALARRAQQEVGGTVLLVGGRDEMPLAQETAGHLTGRVRDLTGRTTLPQLAALLAQVDVMVANDTGPLHLAAALGRPVVAPYTCTKVLLSGPYGGLTGAVETRVGCQGSYRKRCRRLDCMAELTPARLWPILAEILRTWKSTSLSA
jgi:lipopolysaccharide heptosyltransferase I